MKYRYAFAIGLFLTSVGVSTAVGQGREREDKKPPQAQEQRQKKQDQRKRQDQKKQEQQRDKNEREAQRLQDQRWQAQQRQEQQRQQSQRQEQQRQQNLVEQNRRREQQRQDNLRQQQQNQQDQRWQDQQGGNQWRNLLNRNNQMRDPRPGQIIILPNRNWIPNRTHVYNSAAYSGINVWAMDSFSYRGKSRSWDPTSWEYAVEDSLMTLVYRSERMSQALRTSFNRQMGRGNQNYSPNTQVAWDRVQRLDDSLQRLRANTGYSTQSDMRSSVQNSLAIGRQLGDTFYRDSYLRSMVQYEWQDLLFGLNELGRYYGERPL